MHQREIEHIDHSSVQERGVAPSLGEKRGDLIMAVTENQSVEKTVEDVPDGSAENQGEGEHDPKRCVLSYQFQNVPPDGSDSGDSEQAQYRLSPLAVAQFHTESHSVVFDKQDFEPIAEDAEFFSEHHVGFNPHLDGLVKYEQGDDEKGEFVPNAHRVNVTLSFFSFFRFDA